MNILELSEQEIVRRQSLQTLREMGIDPYPAAEFPTNAFSTDIKAEFKDEDEPRQVVIAGRMMGDGDAIGVAVVYYAVYAGHFVAAYAFNRQLAWGAIVGALYGAVGEVLLALHPCSLAVEVGYYLLSQSDGCAARRVELIISALVKRVR